MAPPTADRAVPTAARTSPPSNPQGLTTAFAAPFSPASTSSQESNATNRNAGAGSALATGAEGAEDGGAGSPVHPDTSNTATTADAPRRAMVMPGWTPPRPRPFHQTANELVG